MVSSLCNGAEKAGGMCQARPFLARYAAGQLAEKRAVFTLQAQQRKHEEGCRDLEERTGRTLKSSSKRWLASTRQAFPGAGAPSWLWNL